MKQVEIWDVATRTFHWLLVVAVFVCFFSAENEGLLFIVHAYAGFMVFMLLVFRVSLGLFGSRHSRFSDFVYSWDETKRHGLSVLRLRPKFHVGHNPIGGMMIFAMLAVLVCTAATGFLMVVTKLTWLDDVHEALGNMMQILVGLHIAGVIVEQMLSREKLVQAMFTGSKELPDDLAAKEPSPAPVWRSVILAVMVVILGILAYGKTDYGAAVSNWEHHRDANGD